MNSSFTSKINNFIEKYKLHAFKDVIIFMAILLFFHFLWKIFIRDVVVFDFYQASTDFLARKVYLTSKWVLNVFNVDVVFYDQLDIGGMLRKNVIYYAENNGYVAVGQSCSGLKQFYQWIILMLLYPGPWKQKAWFIPLGLIVFHIVNIFRILGMTAVTIYIPENWSFMHDYVMRPFFYVVMFALWVWWNEKYYIPYKEKKKAA